jgi:peptidylamidoglycolate lyase
MKKYALLFLVAAAVATVVLGQGNNKNTAKYESKFWGQPPNKDWGAGVVSVASDRKQSILVLRRLDPPILVFDQAGQLQRSWGNGLFKRAHSIDVDRNGFVWTTDSDFNVVYKFSIDGKLLMTLGKKGVAGDNNSQDAFNGPTDVAVAPNGDVFVSDGDHNNRIVKFSKDGKFIKIIGGKGTNPGQFAPSSPGAAPTEGLVHAIAFDSKGRLIVVESYNPRIQVFDQEGKFIEQWANLPFKKACGLYIAPDDTIYISDTDANAIQIVKNGKVVEVIPDKDSRPHNIDGDSTGALYTADNTNKTMKKIVRVRS